MELTDEKTFFRLKELLRRTGEFIAYFELVESKMLSWQQQLEHQMASQNHSFQTKTDALQLELNHFQDLLTEAGLARYRITADSTLAQAQNCITSMKQIQQQVNAQLLAYQETLTSLCDKTNTLISHETHALIDRIDAQLSQYHPELIHQMAQKSCDQIALSANSVVNKSNKLLRTIQWRAVMMSFLITVITAFAMGLYISDEWPWEIHQHAMNERNAGKMLIQAWPRLSQQEKLKILSAPSTTAS